MPFTSLGTAEGANDRAEEAHRRILITVALVAVVVYPLSYGPACRVINALANRGWLRPDTDWIRQMIFLVYWPIRRLHSDGPDLIRRAFDWYAHLWY